MNAIGSALRAAFARRAIALAIALACAPAHADDAPALSANVRSGGIDTSQRPEPGSAIHRAQAVGLVYAPFDDVMRAVLDYANYQRFMPNFLVSRVLSRRGDQALLYVQVSALKGLTTLWAEMKVRMLPPSGPTRVVIARMIKGNLKHFEAEWSVRALTPAQTVVTFELWADPDLPLPFGSNLVSDNNEKEARHSIRGLRRYVTETNLVAAPPPPPSKSPL